MSEQGWSPPAGGTEDYVPAGKVRAGQYIRIHGTEYKVTGVRPAVDPAMVRIDVQGREDTGTRGRTLPAMHRERSLLGVLRAPRERGAR